MNIPNYVLCCHLGVCESYEAPHESPDLYAVRDPEWKSPDPRPIIRCNRSIIRRRLTDDRAGESPDRRQAWALYSIGGSPFDSPDDIVRSSDGDCRISVRWPAIFSATFRTVAPRSPLDDRTVSHGPPPDEEKWGGIADHPANFNCELNLPDHRRMSPGWVPTRRMAAGFCRIRAPITARWSGDRFCPIVT